jgi:hypothetical protein
MENNQIHSIPGNACDWLKEDSSFASFLMLALLMRGQNGYLFYSLQIRCICSESLDPLFLHQMVESTAFAVEF